MGRPPSNGGPSFRFNSNEVAEMEGILQAHKYTVPERDLCQTLAEKFSCSAERDGKVVVQMKQIWNWFQNRRYAIRAKHSRAPGKLNVAPLQRNDLASVRSVPQAPQHLHVPPGSSGNNMLHIPQPMTGHSASQNAVKNGADNSQMEFEAKSSRDGAWYDVSCFLSHKSLENAGPAVQVRFAGFGPEEDEWINVQKNVRLRSLPCESSECVAVLPNDLILCFQEGKEQALYYDAHVLDAQRRRHDVRGCRCRFLVRYDHDQSEEIVPLRKVCRRPETDYRLQQLHADTANLDQNKSGSMPNPANPAQVYPVPVIDLTGKKAEIPAQTTPKQSTTGVHLNSGTALAPVPLANAPLKNSAVPSNVPLAPAAAGAVMPSVSMVTNTVPVADTTSKQPMTGVNANTGTVISPVSFANTSVRTFEMPINHSNAPASAGAVDSNVPSVTTRVSVDDTTLKQPMAAVNGNTGTMISPNTSGSTSDVPISHSNTPASAGAVDSNVSSVITRVSVDDDTTPKQPMAGVNGNTGTVISPNSSGSTSDVPINHSNAPASAGAVVSNVSSVITTVSVDDDTTQKQPTAGVNANSVSVISPANTSVSTSERPINHSNAPASAGAVVSNVSPVITTISVDDDTTPKQHTANVNTHSGTLISPVSPAPAPASAGAVDSNVSSVITTFSVDDTTKQPTTGVNENTGTVIPDVSLANTSENTSEVPVYHSNVLFVPASVGTVDSSISRVTDTASVTDATPMYLSTGVNPNNGSVMAPVSLASPPVDLSAVPNNLPNASSPSTDAVVSGDPMDTDSAPIANTMPNQHTREINANSETLISPANSCDVPMKHSNPSAVAADSNFSTGVHANSESLISPLNTCEVPMSHSDILAPASDMAVDSSVSTADKSDREADSSCTVGPAPEVITYTENVATDKSEGTLNVVGEPSSVDAPGDYMQIG